MCGSKRNALFFNIYFSVYSRIIYYIDMVPYCICEIKTVQQQQKINVCICDVCSERTWIWGQTITRTCIILCSYFSWCNAQYHPIISRYIRVDCASPSGNLLHLHYTELDEHERVPFSFQENHTITLITYECTARHTANRDDNCKKWIIKVIDVWLAIE